MRVKRLLDLMDNGEYSLSQLMTLVNLKDRRSFTLNYLNPAPDFGNRQLISDILTFAY